MLFFYGGTVFGYFLGLLWFAKFSIDFTANYFVEKTSENQSIFFLYDATIAFGLIMDIPWLMMFGPSEAADARAIAGKRKLF